MGAGNRKQPERANSSESQYSLMEFMHEFPDDDSCLNWLWKARYSPDGKHASCPKCGVERAFERYGLKQQRQSWTCTGCGYHLHPTAGTIFHKSSTSLHLWFYAMYLMTSTRCGISARQLERELGVTYKTAWRILHLIRHELMKDDVDEPLTGTVEVDEVYIGGRRRGVIGRQMGDHKQPVIGLVERSHRGTSDRRGRVVAKTIENVKRSELLGHVTRRVLPRTVIYTDEFKSYDQLGRQGYQHDRIHHSQGVYVSGDVHTNTIEGFWSLVKRGIDGVHHSVSAKFLQGYLDEYAWRYNHREDGRSQFRELLSRAAV